MTSVEAIISILKEQISGYKVLLNLLQKERSCLIDIDAEKVEELSKEKDTVLMRLRLLEEERQRLTKKFAEDNDLSGDINLKGLGALIGDDALLTLRSQLQSLLQSVEEMNEFNSVLIDRSIKYFKLNTNFFSSFAPKLARKSKGAFLSKET